MRGSLSLLLSGERICLTKNGGKQLGGKDKARNCNAEMVVRGSLSLLPSGGRMRLNGGKNKRRNCNGEICPEDSVSVAKWWNNGVKWRNEKWRMVLNGEKKSDGKNKMRNCHGERWL